MNDFEKASLDDERYDGGDCENVLEWIKNDKKRSAWETQCIMNVGLGKAERGRKRKGDMHV